MKTKLFTTLLLAGLTSGCSSVNRTVCVNPGAIPQPDDLRQGAMGIKFLDKRADDSYVG